MCDGGSLAATLRSFLPPSNFYQEDFTVRPSSNDGDELKKRICSKRSPEYVAQIEDELVAELVKLLGFMRITSYKLTQQEAVPSLVLILGVDGLPFTKQRKWHQPLSLLAASVLRRNGYVAGVVQSHLIIALEAGFGDQVRICWVSDGMSNSSHARIGYSSSSNAASSVSDTGSGQKPKAKCAF